MLHSMVILVLIVCVTRTLTNGRPTGRCRGSIREAGCTPASVFVKKLKTEMLGNPPPAMVFIMTDDWRSVAETQSALRQAAMPNTRTVALGGPERRGRGRHRLCREGIETNQSLCSQDALNHDPMAGAGSLSSLGTFVEFWAELEIVAEADVAVVGHSSNVGRLIEAIRTKAPAAVSVDIAWNPN